MKQKNKNNTFINQTKRIEMKFSIALIFSLVLLSACNPGKPGPMGPAGTPGVAGPQGPQGPQGPEGSSSEAISSVYCSDVDSTNFAIIYKYTTYANGDIFVSCEISDNYQTSTSINHYLANQNGALNKACIVAQDGDSPDYGFWSFEVVNSQPKVTYKDADSANNNYSLNFEDCSEAVRN